MSDEKKKIIYIIIGVIIAVVIIGGIIYFASSAKGAKYEKQLEDGTKINTSKKLNETKIYKTLEISNIKLTCKDKTTSLVADVKNIGDKDVAEENVRILFIGENDEVVNEIYATAFPAIKKGETEQMNVMVMADIVNVKDIRIEPLQSVEIVDTKNK